MNIKSIVYFIFGPLIVGLTSIITIPMLAWYMPTEDIGRINIIQICMSFAIVVASMGLDQFYARNFYESINKKQLALHCLLPGMVVLAFISAITIKNKEEIMRNIFTIDNKIYIITILQFLITVNYLSVFSNLTLRMNHSGAKYTIAIVIPKVITLLFIPALIFYDENNRLEIYVLIIVMATLTGFIYSFINGFKDVVLNKEKIQWKLNELRSALNYGLPMLGSSLIYWAMTSSNAIILKNYTNLGELGRYSLIISLAGVAGVIQSIVTTIWTPIAYQWKIDENNNKNFTLATSIVSILASTVVLSVIIFSSLILNFLPKKYENLEYLLPVAVIPIMFYTISEVSSIGIALANKTILNMIATAIACSINIFLSILLVEDYGLKGVLISSAIAHYVFLVFRTLFSCKVCFIQPVYKLFMSTLICMLFSIIIAIYEIDEWLKILSAIIIFIAIIIIHIKEMLEVVKFYEKKML